MRRLILALILAPLTATAEPLPQALVERNFADAVKCTHFNLRYEVLDPVRLEGTRDLWTEKLKQYRPIPPREYVLADRFLTREQHLTLVNAEAGPDLQQRYRDIRRHCQWLIDNSVH